MSEPETITSSIPEKEPTVTVTGLSVDFLEGGVRCHLGDGIYKYVSYIDFISLLEKSTASEHKKELEEYAWQLPRNTYQVIQTQTSLTMSSYYPSCTRIVQYRDMKRESVLPNLVIVTSMLKNPKGDGSFKVEDPYYFCTNKALEELSSHEVPSLRDPRFSIAPFSNIYDGGRLCYGGNTRVKLIEKYNFKPLNWCHDVLFASPFNDDLGVKAIHANSFPSVGSWYTHIAELSQEGLAFDYSLLTRFR